VGRRLRSIPEEIASLPHWARVAFAAHCAQTVLPLFRRAWPSAMQKRLHSLELATELAEKSAAEGAAADGIKAARIDTQVTAGAAIMPLYNMPSDEPVPLGQDASQVATFASRVAEWAASAAENGPGESANAALEAFSFARQVAEVNGDHEMVSGLASDLVALLRVASRSNWSDQTPVPPSVFSLLSDLPREKPWWRFW
jgi:hypothetical protein